MKRPSVLLRRLSIVSRTPQAAAVNPLTEAVEKLSLVFENEQGKQRALQAITDACNNLYQNKKNRLSRGKTLRFEDDSTLQADASVLGQSFRSEADAHSFRSGMTGYEDRSFRSEFDGASFRSEYNKSFNNTADLSAIEMSPQRRIFNELNSKLSVN